MELLWMFPRDRRVTPMFDNPSVLLAAALLYVWFVMRAGPRWMKNRKPYNLKTYTRVFNLFQVAANFLFIYKTIEMTIRHHERFSFVCNPPSTEQEDLDNEEDMEMVHFMAHAYFLVRLSDWLDTVCFVLTKKQSHVTFLHVYHHVLVIVGPYIYLRSGWAPLLFYPGLTNASIHVIMYSYYFLSTFPSMKPYLWWKKYITGAQILQFIVAGIQLVYIYFHNCGYPLSVFVFCLVQCVIFTALFTNFYIQTYTKSPKKVD